MDVWIFCLCISLGAKQLELAEGHGRLMEPPSRSSMHRRINDPEIRPYKNIIVANYNDMGLNCGGRSNQISNGGRCGVCGDPYNAPEPRENEAGGKFAQGFVTRNYQRGQLIPVTVELTAPHLGYFEFRICPWNNFEKPVTHECLDRHLLSFENHETRYQITSSIAQSYNMNVQLPTDVVCEQCVLQWRYRTGNSWGTENGESGIGLGQQEEFYGCADVAVADGVPPPGNSPAPSTVSSSSTTTRPTTWPTTRSSTTTTRVRTTTIRPTTRRPTTTTTVWPTTRARTTTIWPTTTTTTTTTYSPANVPPTDKITSCKNQPIMTPLPVDGECDRFYQCWNPYMKPYKMRCGPGTVYNSDIRRCDHPYNVAPPCGTRQW
ncbi:uncharacterized protein LOC100181283 [Ciona intestinalis]